MNHWRQVAWLALLAVATSVLLAMALPEVAWGASLPTTTNGTVSGTVTISGAPAGFTPAFVGAGACPASTTSGISCADPVYSLAANGSYSLSLPPGSWVVSGFYENNGFGGVFLATPVDITVPNGGTVTANFTVPYQAPATVKGTVRVTRVPAGVTLEELSVLLCPALAPYSGGNASILCVTTYSETSPGTNSAQYDVTGLPPGSWTAYPSYCTEFGCSTNAAAGKALTLVSGHTTRARVQTSFVLPGEGLLSATVSVTGAPAGFSDAVAVTACQVGGGSCQAYSGFGGSPVSLLLPDGQWTVTGAYLAAPFNNSISGPSETVTISGGRTTTVALSVPYEVLGAATGAIRVAGKPSGVRATSYTVVACPSSVDGRFSPQCVNEYSGPGGVGIGVSISDAAKRARGQTRASFDTYAISTLTPGSWTLYPGYGTAFGSFSDPVGTKVTIVAGQTITQRLTIPYQAPSEGAVTGKVIVTGAPVNGFESGVEACSAPPSALSCADGQEAFSQSDGTYSLTLAPGTWWLSGFADLFSTGLSSESTSAPQEVTVAPGAQLKANFIVNVAG